MSKDSKCGKCNGTGRIVPRFPRGFWSSNPGGDGKVLCPKCKGTGRAKR